MNFVVEHLNTMLTTPRVSLLELPTATKEEQEEKKMPYSNYTVIKSKEL